MKIKTKLILITSIFIVSISAYALIPVAISTALQVASKAPTLLNNAKNAWGALSTSGKVAVSIGATGVLELSQLGGGLDLVSEGLYSSSEPSGDYSKHHGLYTTCQGSATYTLNGQSVYDKTCQISDVYYPSTSYSLAPPDCHIASQEETVNTYPFGTHYGDWGDPLVCNSVSTGSVADFSNPVSREVSLLSDSNGDYYLDSSGNRTPVYKATPQELSDAHLEETGSPFDFLSAIWDSLPFTDKPEEYQGLSFDDASMRADYYQNEFDTNPECEFENSDICTPDNILTIVNDLPVPHDYAQTDYSVSIKSDFEKGITIIRDSDGNYVKTVVDNFAVSETTQDGVVVDTDTSYVNREEVIDPLLVGTVGTPNSAEISPDSTYLDYSTTNYSTNTEAQNLATDQFQQDTLSTASLEGLIQNSNSLLTSIDNQLSSGFDASPSVDLTNDFTAFNSGLPSDTVTQDSLFGGDTNFDLDSYSYPVTLFGTTACTDLTFNIHGHNYNFSMSGICNIWAFFGLLLYGFSFYWSTQIVLSSLRG